MIKRLLGKMKRREGVALITTLMIVALLVTVVIEFNRIAVAEIDISQNFGDEKKILYTVISGVKAISELLRVEKIFSPGVTLTGKWAQSHTYFVAASSMMEEESLEGEITDENGKINVNRLCGEKGEFNDAQKALWERLLKQSRFELSAEQVDTIIHSVKDWIDGDDKMTGIYGAEEAFYETRGYPCKNRPLDYVEELLLIKGITEEIFYGSKEKEGLRPYFTVYGDPQININTAPLPVMMALSENMTESIAADLDAYRRDSANQMQLAKKTWYQTLWPLEVPLPEELFVTTSAHFRVEVKGTLRESVKEVSTVIHVSDSGSQILFWREM
jgi:general secretion pathway protein K